MGTVQHLWYKSEPGERAVTELTVEFPDYDVALLERQGFVKIDKNLNA